MFFFITGVYRSYHGLQKANNDPSVIFPLRHQLRGLRIWVISEHLVVSSINNHTAVMTKRHNINTADISYFRKVTNKREKSPPRWALPILATSFWLSSDPPVRANNWPPDKRGLNKYKTKIKPRWRAWLMRLTRSSCSSP